MAFIKGDFDVAFIGDFQRRIQGFGHIGKEVRHFVAALHIKLIIIETEMRRVIEGTARRNTELDFLCRCVTGVDVMVIIGRHQLQTVLLGPALEYRADDFFLGNPVILDFQVKVILAEKRDQAIQRPLGPFFIMIEDILLDVAFDAGTHSDESFMILFEQIIVDTWLVIIIFPIDEALGHDFDEIMIALIVLGQQNQMAEPFLSLLFKTAAPGHIHFTPQNRLDALGYGFFIQINDTVHIAMIRNRHSRHVQLLSPLHHVGNLAQAVE
ncbi:uncharacterized protein BN715_00858 [Megasphaera elsdenii CAG:570]|uniref:Uncharacterized protein n=1 Tax=Megasphaera elsdenii CAG:570 TaxID=1263087 RepID=R7MTK3_MEGEL|nr:uncharacterized protein BN715_00858 [Megasphaera elsdenii CAG:570]